MFSINARFDRWKPCRPDKYANVLVSRPTNPACSFIIGGRKLFIAAKLTKLELEFDFELQFFPTTFPEVGDFFLVRPSTSRFRKMLFTSQTHAIGTASPSDWYEKKRNHTRTQESKTVYFWSSSPKLFVFQNYIPCLFNTPHISIAAEECCSKFRFLDL